MLVVTGCNTKHTSYMAYLLTTPPAAGGSRRARQPPEGPCRRPVGTINQHTRGLINSRDRAASKLRLANSTEVGRVCPPSMPSLRWEDFQTNASLIQFGQVLTKSQKFHTSRAAAAAAAAKTQVVHVQRARSGRRLLLHVLLGAERPPSEVKLCCRWKM